MALEWGQVSPPMGLAGTTPSGRLPCQGLWQCGCGAKGRPATCFSPLTCTTPNGRLPWSVFIIVLTLSWWAQFSRGERWLHLEAGHSFRVHLPQRLQLRARAGVATELSGGVQLAPAPWPPGTTPNEGLPWSVCPSPSDLILPILLLQLGQLTAPNLNLWCAPPGGARVGHSRREWVWMALE